MSNALTRAAVRLRARIRVVRAWVAERHAAMAALGSRTTLTADEWIGADAMTVCPDHSRHIAHMEALRTARAQHRLATRRLKNIGASK